MDTSIYLNYLIFSPPSVLVFGASIQTEHWHSIEASGLPICAASHPNKGLVGIDFTSSSVQPLIADGHCKIHHVPPTASGEPEFLWSSSFRLLVQSVLALHQQTFNQQRVRTMRRHWRSSARTDLDEGFYLRYVARALLRRRAETLWDRPSSCEGRHNFGRTLRIF